MFDAGVKETLCTRCAHREVCIYKQDYLDIIKAVENYNPGYTRWKNHIKESDSL
mgnify:CR=1 FL=1